MATSSSRAHGASTGASDPELVTDAPAVRRTAARRLLAAAALLALLAFYAAVAIWLTWPLAARATTDLPKPTPVAADIFTATWLLAWHTHALTTDPRILIHPNAFYPSRLALFYAPPALSPLPLFAPVYLASQSASVAYAVAFLGGLALAGLSAAVVVRRWTRSTAAGWIAGTVLVTSPGVWQVAGTAPLCTMLAALPWLVDGAARRRIDAGRVAVIVGALAIQGFADPLFALFAALLPLGIVTAVRLARPATRRAGLQLAGCLILGLVVLSPLLLGYGVAWLHLDPERTSPWGTATAVIIAQQLAAPGLGVAWSVLGVAALGGLLAARRGTLRHPGWRHAALWSAVGLSYPLVFFPLLERLVTWRPDLLELVMPFRSFGRLTNDMLATVPLLVGLAAAELLRRADEVAPHAVTRPLVTAAAIGLLLLSGAPTHPYQTTPAPELPPEAHEIVARRGGPVLELPVTGPGAHAVAMYHSIGGWWPVLNGYASFWPPGFDQRMETARRLPEPAALRELVADTGVATVIVHASRIPGPGRARWWSTVDPERAGLRRLWQRRGEIVFAVEATPAPPRRPDSPGTG